LRVATFDGVMEPDQSAAAQRAGGVVTFAYRKRFMALPGADPIIDEIIKSRISDGFVRSSRSRLANLENTAIAGAVGSVLMVRRSDGG
jgi:hypothetical protein